MSEASNKNVSDLVDSEDIPVDLSGPTFEGQSVTAVITDWNRADAERGTFIELSLETEGPITSTSGNRFEAGYKLKDRLTIKPVAGASNGDMVKKIAIETLGRVVQATGALTKNQPLPAEIFAALPAAVGQRVLLVLKTSKKGFQQIQYRRVKA